MRHFIILFIVLVSFCGSHESFAGRKIQWQKFLNDTTLKAYNPTWRVQSAVVDNDNNVYLSSITNGWDSMVALITKVSPDGQILWRQTVFPIPNANGFQTNHKGKLYVDIDSNIVYISTGFDSLVQASPDSNGFFLLKKWTKNGVPISTLVDYLPDSCANMEDLTGIQVMQNGDIYVSGISDNYYNIDILCRKYDKNFNKLFTYRQHQDLGTGGLVYPSVIAIKDSFLHIAYATDSNNFHNTYILQINTSNGDTIWQNKIHQATYYPTPLQLEIMQNSLFLVSNHLVKFNINTGSIIAEDNLQYNPGNCIFDSATSSIYSLHTSGAKAAQMTSRYDTNLVQQEIIPYPLWPYYMTKKDTVLSVLCPIKSLLFPLYSNGMGIFRIGPGQNLLDTLFYSLPSTIRGFGNSLLIADNNNDIIIISEVLRLQVYDTILGSYYQASPIFIQKICYDCVDDLQGKVFFDTQNDCLYDSTETIVENNYIHLLPEDIYTKTDKEGKYSFAKSSGIATVEYVSKFGNAYLCNANNTYTVNIANGINDTLHFGLLPKGPYKDLTCSLISGVARPWFKQFSIFDAENLSTQKVYNSKCIITLDSLFTYFEALPIPDSIAGYQLYWDIDSLNPGEIKEIILLNYVQAPLNYHYKHTAVVQTMGDNYLANNTDTATGLIIGAFDPNYKSANPEGIGPQHFIENTTPINYYVEFQNTGTDTAFNIKILDDLDNDLDINTLVVKKASHPMHYKIVNRQLQFYFDHILLVDSNKDYQKSIGFLTYSIMPRKCVDGTVINNKADIYFDFNEPVGTNTTFHTIGRPGCLFDNENLNDFNFFPNPVSDQSMMITVNMATDEKYDIILSDIAGKEIYKLSSPQDKKGKYQHPINFSKMVNAGIYFLTLKTASNNISKKVIFGN